MLENYAQAELNKLKVVVDQLENQLRHVRDKCALRKSLNEKKEIAAKQFFELTFNELKRIEDEFWDNYSKESNSENILLDKLEQFAKAMDNEYSEVQPLFEALEEKIQTSEFYDVIGKGPIIW